MINLLQKDCAMVETDYYQFEHGEPVSKRLKKQTVVHKHRLKTLCQQLNKGEKSLSEFCMPKENVSDSIIRLSILVKQILLIQKCMCFIPNVLLSCIIYVLYKWRYAFCVLNIYANCFILIIYKCNYFR